MFLVFFFFQAEDGIRDRSPSRGLGDVYKRQGNSLSVLKMAIEHHGKPEIINSDLGSQFTCALWIEYVDSQNILISMDGRGRATDNIFIERLWRTVKRDYIYIRPADNGTELFKGLNTF